MEKKSSVLTISVAQKTLNSIEQAKSKSKNTVVIEKKTSIHSSPVNHNFQDKIITSTSFRA